jgi:hypothetical protein
MRDLLNLLEGYEYTLLLETPQRAAWLLQNFGPKLEAKYKEQVEHNAVPSVVQNEIEGKEGEDIAPKLVAYLMSADPTPNKAYSRWIALRYLKNDQHLEDVNDQLSQQLGIFHRAAIAKRVDANIDAIKTFSDLFAVVEPFVIGDREVSGKMDRKNKRETKVDTRVARQWDVDDPMREHADVIYDEEDYIVLIPTDMEASVYFGKNTNWCTTSREHYFSSYSNQGPLYIILRRRDGVKWQFHFPTKQFMDRTDRSVDLDEWIKENPSAFNAIGADKFATLIGTSYISIDHFDEDVIARQADEVLVRLIKKASDLKKLPSERIYTKEFFGQLLGRLGRSIEESEAKKIVAIYIKVLNDPEYFTDILIQHQWLLNWYPAKLQTDAAKAQAGNGLTSYHHFEEHIPEPWPVPVQERYWGFRSHQDRALKASEIPEEHRTDGNIRPVLAYHPEEIPDFANRLNAEMVGNMLRTVDHKPDRLADLLTYLPEEFKTASLQKEVYALARDLKNKSDSDRRDEYLRALCQFDNNLWPWKAPKLSNRMAEINPDFFANPEQFQTRSFAPTWLSYDPTKLHTLPAEFISPEAVEAAIRATPRSGALSASALKQVLEPCDPNIVTVEMVAPALEKHGVNSSNWGGIPEKYMTRDTIQVLVERGTVPFDDARYPKDLFTPENILARFQHTVKPTFTHTVTKADAEEAAEKAGKDKRWISYGQKVERDNVTDMKEEWDKLPSFVDRKEALKGILAGDKFRAIIRVIDKNFLSDPEILTAWLKGTKRYGGSGVRGTDARELFKLFPKSAYTPENMALAVKDGYVEKVPDNLRNDDVMLNLMANWSSKKTLDWSKVTPELFLKHVRKNSYDAASNFQFNVPAKSPLFSNADIALQLLKKEKGEGVLEVDDKTLHSIYGKDASRRKNWSQDCYDLAAGSIVALKDIPEKFRSDTAIHRAISTRPESVAVVSNAEEWLNEHGKKFPNNTIKRLLGHGIALIEGNRWVDVRETERTEVKGKGSYAFVDSSTGPTLMIFGKDGECIDAIMSQDINTSHHYERSKTFASEVGRSYENRVEPIRNIAPYRAILVAAFAEKPEFTADLSDDQFTPLRCYKHEGVILPVEKWPRTAVKGHDLTYVNPPQYGSKWNGGNKSFLFDGSNGPYLGMIATVEAGRGVGFASCSFSKNAPMKRLLELSSAMTEFISGQGVASGNNPTFKESDLYTKLGVRGPGKHEWFSLLEEKIDEIGELAVWKGGKRVTITHNQHGVLAVAKETKAGLSWESMSEEASKYQSKFDGLIAAMRKGKTLL